VVYADNVNLFGENINTTDRATEAVSDSGTEEIETTNQNCIHGNIKERSNPVSAHRQSDENILSSCRLSKESRLKYRSFNFTYGFVRA
jgi:hypothetical protein